MKYRISRPKTVFQAFKFESHLPLHTQDVNDRRLYPRLFEKLGVSVLYSCQPYRLEVTKWGKDKDHYTGGDMRFFATEREAFEDAFNIRIGKIEKQTTNLIADFKAAVSK